MSQLEIEAFDKVNVTSQYFANNNLVVNEEKIGYISDIFNDKNLFCNHKAYYIVDWQIKLLK